MAGAPSLTEFLRTSTIPAIVETRNTLTKEQQENYFKTLAFVDSINYIGYVAPSALFLQFGKKDAYPSEEQATLYAKAASSPKLVKFYDAGHDLNDEARRDRAEWLQKQIKLGKLNWKYKIALFQTFDEFILRNWKIEFRSYAVGLEKIAIIDNNRLTR